jgi:chondroitin 4-sulfotransferase 11
MLIGNVMRMLVGEKRWARWRRIPSVPVEMLVSDTLRVVYLVNSKVACSSIKASILTAGQCERRIPDDYSVHRMEQSTTWRLGHKEKTYFKFTFVRNPFDRLVSCYVSKFINDRKFGKFDLEYSSNGSITPDMTFDGFVKAVSAIPDYLADSHFKSQQYLIYRQNRRTRLDFIGRFEDLDKQYQLLAERFGLAPLPHYNVTDKGDWREYYTPELLEMVRERYKKDIEVFGYDDAYNDLRKIVRAEK